MMTLFASREPRRSFADAQAVPELATMPLLSGAKTAQVLAVAELYRASTGLVPKVGWTLLASSIRPTIRPVRADTR